MSEQRQESLAETTMGLFIKGHTRKEVEEILQKMGHEEFYAKKIVEECVKLRTAKKQTQGMTFIFVGAIFCFTSFLLTITSASLTGSSWALFGLTSAGVLIIFIGLMLIFS